MTNSGGSWLHDLGLGRYADAFIREDIGSETLVEWLTPLSALHARVARSAASGNLQELGAVRDNAARACLIPLATVIDAQIAVI